MRRGLQAADLVAFAILAILVGVIGTGAGVAAAHVRDSGGASNPAPLRVILHQTSDVDVPSLQRDRARLEPRRR